uniref:Uncharacterized protein n=1 Tax=Rhizophora mucronata TaxID=61149 RepID=A0A2P2NW74_RHIMU
MKFLSKKTLFGLEFRKVT